MSGGDWHAVVVSATHRSYRRGWRLSRIPPTLKPHSPKWFATTADRDQDSQSVTAGHQMFQTCDGCEARNNRKLKVNAHKSLQLFGEDEVDGKLLARFRQRPNLLRSAGTGGLQT